MENKFLERKPVLIRQAERIQKLEQDLADQKSHFNKVFTTMCQRIEETTDKKVEDVLTIEQLDILRNLTSNAKEHKNQYGLFPDQ